MVFTGLVQAIGRAVFDPQTNKLHVKADSPAFWSPCAAGDSIAINGCCLTILQETNTDTATFFVMEESRAKTNLANLALAKSETEIPQILSNDQTSTAVNMERALRVGDPLGGHTVTGHVDGVAPITATHEHEDKSLSVWIQLPPQALVVHKGSITLDGVSLTVAELKAGQLRVSLIPHTLAHTTLHLACAGRMLNVEFDQALKLMEQRTSGKQTAWAEVTKMDEYSRRNIDEDRMRRAIEMGEMGKETASPNPWVGCVITDRFGMILGEGYHQKAGHAHAEIRAIEHVKQKFPNDFEERLRGATCYTTLEPCSHFGRTGPCDQQLIKYGFSRVVVALTDPDVNVRGRGIQHLKDAGIEVVLGVCEKEVLISLQAYLKHRNTGKPWVVLKIAASLDSKIAAADSKSQWISSQESRTDVHQRWRASSQAILVGSGTAKADDPSLTTRQWFGHVDQSFVVPPLRIVVGNDVQLGKNLLDTKIAPTIVFTSESAQIPQEWIVNNVEVIRTKSSTSNTHVDFDQVLDTLGARGVLQLLVEGGATLGSSLLQAGLVDHLVLYQAPLVLGLGGLDWSKSPAASPALNDAKPLKLLKISTFGNDVCIEYTKS